MVPRRRSVFFMQGRSEQIASRRVDSQNESSGHTTHCIQKWMSRRRTSAGSKLDMQSDVPELANHLAQSKWFSAAECSILMHPSERRLRRNAASLSNEMKRVADKR